MLLPRERKRERNVDDAAWLYCHSNSTWIADILCPHLWLASCGIYKTTCNYVISRKKPIELFFFFLFFLFFSKRPFMQYTNEAYKRERSRAFVTASRCPRAQTIFTLIFLFSKLLLYNKLEESQHNSHSRKKKTSRDTWKKATDRDASSHARHGFR